MGVYNNYTCGNSMGWGGGYFCVQKLEILGRRGACRKFPVVGVWIFSGITHYIYFCLLFIETRNLKLKTFLKLFAIFAVNLK